MSDTTKNRDTKWGVGTPIIQVVAGRNQRERTRCGSVGGKGTTEGPRRGTRIPSASTKKNHAQEIQKGGGKKKKKKQKPL